MVRIIKMAAILAIICAVSAWGLAYVYNFTKVKIDSNAQLFMEKSKQEVLPSSGQGRVAVVSSRGYSSEIKMLVGIDPQGKVSGIKILEQRETPGLGAKAAEPAFLRQFIGKSQQDVLEPKKNIDAITGATITSRAVCRGVREALEKGKK